MLSASPLRAVRMVEHIFAEIALAAVDAGVVVAALDVAVLAAIDIFLRADRDIVGAAERIVVAAGIGHGRLTALEAAGEERGCEQERDERSYGTKSHAWSVQSIFVVVGLDPSIHQKQGDFG